MEFGTPHLAPKVHRTNKKVPIAMQSLMQSKRPRFWLAALAAVIAQGFVPADASAARLPAIKASGSNMVPECVTPGRLMALLKARNPGMDSRFSDIATYYMKHGEELGIRWDQGFFQMIVETNSLRFNGDVHHSQNNFAGLGATGGGVRGERFRSVSDGVRAHLEHILMYSGEYIDNPVAERTRKVQEWRVLDKWRNSISGPVAFHHLTRKWAPGDRGYAADIKTIADEFFDRHCASPDPRPDLLAAARGNTTGNAANEKRVKVAANTRAEAASAGSSAQPASTRSFQVLNASEQARSRLGATPDAGTADTGKSGEQDETRVATLSPGAAKGGVGKSDAGGSNTAAAAKPGKCRVWQASYGGSKALIIKAVDKGVINYTVLDVNAGREKREADAYIAAYAKGGETIENFSNPKAALAKAFELCPEKK